MTLIKKIIRKIIVFKLVIQFSSRIAKYKNNFEKGFVSNWYEEVFLIKTLKTLCRGHAISDLNGEEIVETFYEKESQKKQVKKSLELKK